MMKNKKVGRPPVKHKKDQQLATQVTFLDRKIIENNAKKCMLTVSEYLREIGINGKINLKIKTLPKEVLQLIAHLSHVGGNINQIAFQLNSKNLLTPNENIRLDGLVEEIKEVVKIIRDEFKT